MRPAPGPRVARSVRRRGPHERFTEGRPVPASRGPVRDNGPVSRPYRVMTVCTGNICRSPMAEVVLRDRFERAGLGDVVVVDSTGVSGEEDGNPIDHRAQVVLRAAGYDVPRRRARQVTAVDLASHDLVLAMTASHARALRRIGHDEPALAERVRMYRSFDPAAPTGVPEHELDVDDPWYGDQAGFETTLAEVEAAADGGVEHVRRALRAAQEGGSTGRAGGPPD